MDEAKNSLQPESDNPADGVSLADAARKARDILSKNKNKVIATGLAAAAIGGGTAAGVKLNQSPKPEVRADVPYQKYGTSGYKEPIAQFDRNSPNRVIEGFKPV